MDYHQLNQVVTPIVSAAPDMVSLLDPINIDPSNWSTVIDLPVFFPSIPTNKKPLGTISFLQ